MIENNILLKEEQKAEEFLLDGKSIMFVGKKST